MNELEISVAPMSRICRKAGAKRVSQEGAKELGKVLEGFGIKIAKEALDYATYAKRKTIKVEDIKIAVRKVMEK